MFGWRAPPEVAGGWSAELRQVAVPAVWGVGGGDPSLSRCVAKALRELVIEATSVAGRVTMASAVAAVSAGAAWGVAETRTCGGCAEGGSSWWAPLSWRSSAETSVRTVS
jgi:hypothetical protein